MKKKLEVPISHNKLVASDFLPLENSPKERCHGNPSKVVVVTLIETYF